MVTKQGNSLISLHSSIHSLSNKHHHSPLHPSPPLCELKNIIVTHFLVLQEFHVLLQEVTLVLHEGTRSYRGEDLRKGKSPRVLWYPNFHEETLSTIPYHPLITPPSHSQTFFTQTLHSVTSIKIFFSKTQSSFISFLCRNYTD